MEHNTSSHGLMFVFQGSETEGFELNPIFPIMPGDGDPLLRAFIQDTDPLSGEDELPSEVDSEDFSDLLDAFPLPPSELPVPFSQEPRHPTSGQYRFSVTFSEPVSAEICAADLIRLIVRHPVHRSVVHRARVLRGSLGTPLWGHSKLQRRVLSSRNTAGYRHSAHAPRHRSVRRKVGAFR